MPKIIGRRLGQILKAVEPLPRMRHQDERILLEERGDGDDRDVLFDRVEGLDHIGAHVEVDPARRQQQPTIALRAALQNGDVEAIFRIGAVGHGLIEAAVLRLGPPIGGKSHVVERCGRECSRHEDEAGNKEGKCRAEPPLERNPIALE